MHQNLTSGWALGIAALLLTACQPRAYHVVRVQSGPLTAAQPVTGAAPVDSATEQYLRPYRQAVSAQMREVLATSRQEWVKPGGTGNNAPLTRWLAALMRTEASRALGRTPDIGALTNGSVRTGMPAGDVTVGRVYEIMPFENELTVLALPGPTVRQLCTYAVKHENVAAIGLTWRADTVAKRAYDIRVGGQPLDSARTYSMSINDYLANGGDGMEFLRGLPQTPARRTIRQAMFDFLRREKVVLPAPAEPLAPASR